MKWLVGLVGVVLGLAGCTGSNSKSCLDGTCGDPARPFCDVDGTLSGTPGLCVSVDCTPGTFSTCRGDAAVVCNDSGTSYDVTQCEYGCGSLGCRRCMANASSCGENDALFTCDADGVQLLKVQDCQYGCTTDHCNACAASTTFCSGDDLVMCTSGGDITNPMSCQFGCQGTACNECTPNTTFCQGSNAITCTAAGKVGATQSCGAAGCQSGLCNTCTPNTTTCQGDNLVVCNAGGTIQSATACALGCGTTGSAHCKALVPSFGIPAPSGSLPDLTVSDNAVLDIANCAARDVKLTIGSTTTAVPTTQIAVVSQSGAGAPPICVVKYGAISILDPFRLTVTSGSSPGHVLSLQGTGDITVGGKIVFVSNDLGPAPGASVYSIGLNSGNQHKTPGAGGGGAAFAGGNGGTCVACNGSANVAGGVGGSAFTFTNTLLGGSRGGDAWNSSFLLASGGRGGGGLHLVSLTRVTFAASAVVSLNGEGGGGPSQPADPGAHTAGGGGSGGMLVVEAPTVTVSAGAIAAANGGGGAGAGINFISDSGTFYNSHAFGQSGQLSATRAAGGDILATTFGDGGYEAEGSATPSADGQSSDAGAAMAGGGAGGGARGFIVLRARAAGNIMIAFGAVISPAPTQGTVTAQ